MKAQSASAVVDGKTTTVEADASTSGEAAARPPGPTLPFFRVGAEGARWDDPTVPVGDSPPLPRWPMYFWIGAWAVWIVVLIGLAIFRLGSPRI